MTSELHVNGARLIADASGALWWPAQATLIVADLHFEKAAALARRGTVLPPYDTRATLDRLTAVIGRYAPSRVISLGDSIHDGGAIASIAAADRARIADLTRQVEWLWVAGNHDPAPPESWGGQAVAAWRCGPLVFRHEAQPGPVAGEISGHFHPKATIRTRAKRHTGRCFIGTAQRLILPAFGAFTGGLNVADPAIATLFETPPLIHLLGRDRVYAFPASALCRDVMGLPPNLRHRARFARGE